MRFKLTLSRTGKSKFIPVDYQYFIGAWIYKIIGKADKQLAAFLHGTGYGESSKKFKYFNYSPLDLKPYTLWKEKQVFELQNDQISFCVSFLIDRIAESFIKGLFLNQEIFIGDRFNGIDFMVTRVESLPMPLFKETMHYSLKSALVLSVKEPDNKALYLSPDDGRYKNCFIKHLSEKFNTVLIARPQLREEIPVDTEIPFGLKITSRFRSRLHTIKPGTSEQTRVRGFVYDFELTAPVEIHEMAYSAGFGEKNAIGFGWGEVIKY